MLALVKRVRFPDDAVSCFFVSFFFLFGLFILTVDPAGLALGSIYILRLSPEFYFGKWISKALDLHTWPSLRPEKNHKLSLL